MSKYSSLLMLFGMVAVVGLLLFHVVKPFAIAIFVAIVLAVLFTPLHQWLTKKMWHHERMAAAAATLIVIVLVLVPISLTLLMAGTQVMQAGNDVVVWLDERSDSAFHEAVDKLEASRIGSVLNRLHQRLPVEQREELGSVATRISESITAELYGKTRSLLSDLFTFGLSAGIMALGLYYFLADRKLFVGELHRMLPLDDFEEQTLVDRFQQVCRGVVLGTVVAGIVQATLAGIAFGVIGIPQVWLLIVLTMFCSFIPFVGSTVVWGSVAIWLLIEGRVPEGIGLAVYGAAIISTSDNLVRAHIIGNQARLHPLIALVTVLGAIKLIGLWGIFVGPMVAAFLYALLNIAKERVARQRQFKKPIVEDYEGTAESVEETDRESTRRSPAKHPQLAK